MYNKKITQSRRRPEISGSNEGDKRRDKTNQHDGIRKLNDEKSFFIPFLVSTRLLYLINNVHI